MDFMGTEVYFLSNYDPAKKSWIEVLYGAILPTE